MPPMMRIKRLRGITDYIKVVRGNLARCEAAKQMPAFKNELSGLKIALSQLQSMTMEVREATDGYATAKAVRRSLDVASREMDHLQSLLEILIEEAGAFTDIQQIDSSKFFPQLLAIELALRAVRFSPDIPRQKITREQLAEIEKQETSDVDARYSNMNTSQPGSVGDAQLEALKRAMGE